MADSALWEPLWREPTAPHWDRLSAWHRAIVSSASGEHADVVAWLKLGPPAADVARIIDKDDCAAVAPWVELRAGQVRDLRSAGRRRARRRRRGSPHTLSLYLSLAFSR